jgi:hypothetical protein
MIAAATLEARDDAPHGGVRGRERGAERLAVQALILISCLNLNGVFNLMFGVGQVMSIALLGASLFLVNRAGLAGLSPMLAAFVGTMASYLAIGSIFSATFSDAAQFAQTLSYAGSILLIWAIASYVGIIATREETMRLLGFARNALLVSCASIWLSQHLYRLYVNAPIALDRNAGVFGNANEAGMMAVITFAMLLAVPYRSRALHALAIVIALGAVLLTFSKTSMLAVIVVWLLHAYRTSRVWHVLVMAGALLLFSAFAQDLAEQHTIDLTDSQRIRLLQVAQILSGEVNAETTTGRSELWAHTLQRAIANFPFGEGLGSYHNIVGQKLENDVWQGVHNTYLMMLGEAGPLPFLLLVLVNIALLVRAWRAPLAGFELSYVLVMSIDMMATHHLLSIRYHNVMLGLVLGLLALQARSTLGPGEQPQPAPAGPATRTAAMERPRGAASREQRHGG